jgi:hypothetical protein
MPSIFFLMITWFLVGVSAVFFIFWLFLSVLLLTWLLIAAGFALQGELPDRYPNPDDTLVITY